jgi:hypothetical protein
LQSPLPAFLYATNVSPRDRFDRLELQLDNGSTAIIRRGVAYDLTANEAARAQGFVVLQPVGAATGEPQEIVRLPVVGTPQQGDVPIWSSALGAFVPGEVSGAGGGGVVTEGQLSDSRLVSEVLENESKVVGPISVTFFGAPGDGSTFLWPDGTYGTWRLASDGVYSLNSVDHVDGFTVTYRPITATPNERTQWRTRSSSFAPLSDAAAAALVTHVPEVRSENTARNAYTPSSTELSTFHSEVATANATDAQNPYLAYVTGQPGLTNPSTDDLIQWTSHKWGLPTDWVRAQMALESRWSMDFLGDLTTEPDSAHYNAAPPYARVPSTLNVYESLGISQLRWFPDKTGNLNPHPGTDPLRWKSTAFNLDVYGATVRAFYDDPGGWRTAWGDGYSPTESNHEWLSIGGWFQPYPWGNSGQTSYVASVQARLPPNVQPWLVADWTNVAADVKLVRQPTWSRGPFGAVVARPVPTIEAWVPPTAPGGTTGLSVSPGNTTLSLNWTPPTEQRRIAAAGLPHHRGQRGLDRRHRRYTGAPVHAHRTDQRPLADLHGRGLQRRRLRRGVKPGLGHTSRAYGAGRPHRLVGNVGQRQRAPDVDRSGLQRRVGDHRLPNHPQDRRCLADADRHRVDGRELQRHRAHERHGLHLRRARDQRRGCVHGLKRGGAVHASGAGRVQRPARDADLQHWPSSRLQQP